MININYKKTPIEKSTKTEVLNDLKNSIDNSDMILITKLNNLRSTLNNDNVNMKSVKQQIKDLAKFDQIQQYDYLSNLLKPEKAKGCKMPSQIPIPSCSFQLHNSVTLSTNASGNMAFIMNPFFLASTKAIGTRLPTVVGNATYVHKYLTSAWVNNDDSLTGSASNDKWTPVDLGQTIPPVYDQYRLVSASLVVKYIGRLDTVQGLCGGAIFYDDNSALGGQVQTAGTEDGAYNPNGNGVNVITSDLDKFGNFDLAEDSYYHSENMTLEGVRELYFPIDNGFEEYNKILDNNSGLDATGQGEEIEFIVEEQQMRSGFNWFFYATNAPPNSNCFKFDIYCNFECLPNAQFLNYMPISLTPFVVPPEEKKKAILFIQSKPIMKSGENTYDEVAVPNLFNKMIKKFDNGLPGFDKLKASGLMAAAPGLKPGLALAGSMLSAQSMEFDD